MNYVKRVKDRRVFVVVGREPVGREPDRDVYRLRPRGRGPVRLVSAVELLGGGWHL